VYHAAQQDILARLSTFSLILRGTSALWIVIVIVSVIARRIVVIVVIIFIVVVVQVQGIVRRTGTGRAQSTHGQG
jgi:ABC-type microcin C transport system permease subunit YejE